MKKFLFVFLVLICVFFTACENFLEGASSREIIEDTVAIAKSENVDLTIKARSEQYGILEPEGDLTFKAAQKVRVNFKLNPLYVFSRWAVIDKTTGQEVDDAVLLTDKLEEIDSSGNTILYATLIFKKNRKNLQLMPVCYIKTDKTAPEFSDFQVYNLGIYNTDDESQNVLVTDKPFDEWSGSDDYVNHHVNGLKLKFTVREEDSDIRDCKLKVTESMIKESDGESISLVSNDEQSINKSTEIISNDDFSYTVSFDYKFVSPYDGILKINLRMEDTAGNLSDAKTVYVVKDTVIKIFETYEEFNWETYEYEERISVRDIDDFAENLSFYYLPSMVLKNSTSVDDPDYMLPRIHNFLSDTGTGGYATPEGFKKLLSKLYFSGSEDIYDTWFNYDSELKDKLFYKVYFSSTGNDYTELKFAEQYDGDYDHSKYLLKDRIKIFSNESEPEYLYYESDAWYFDVSSYKKSDILYFRFDIIDSAGNVKSVYWNNSLYKSAYPDRLSRIYHRGFQTYDIGHSDEIPIYDWSSKLQLESSENLNCNFPSDGFFYYITALDGTTSNIFYSKANSSFINYSWSGGTDGEYISKNNELVVKYGLQDYCTEKGPSDYEFSEITLWNVSCQIDMRYVDEVGEEYSYTYYDLTDEKSFDYKDIYEKKYKDEITVGETDNEDGTVNLSFYYDGYIKTAGLSSYGWQIFVKYNGNTYVSTNSPEYDTSGNSLTIPNVPVNIIRNGITFEAWGKCSGIPVTFTNTTYCNPNSGKDTIPPERITRAGEYTFKYINEYYPYDNYPGTCRVFTFTDKSFVRNEIIDIDVYYTTIMGKVFTEDERNGLNHIVLHSEPVKNYADDPSVYSIEGIGYADVIFDYSFFGDKLYRVFFVVKDKSGNECSFEWPVDTRLFKTPLTAENYEEYCLKIGQVEGISLPWGNTEPYVNPVYDSLNNKTSFYYMYVTNLWTQYDIPNGQYSNTVYYCADVTYWREEQKEGQIEQITKEEYEERIDEDAYRYYTQPAGIKNCSIKNIIRSDEDGVFYVYCDNNVLVEYLVNDTLLSYTDVDYWEHHTSNRNKTFTEIKVANEGQSTIKAYKIPKVPAGKYGFIIFHFADGTTFTSEVLEG